MTTPSLFTERPYTNQTANRLFAEDRAVHDWYRFVLSYPPHLVRDYMRRWGVQPRHRILDPFSGTGTTLVEAKKVGIGSVGIEANPVVQFASSTKLDWTPDPGLLVAHAGRVAALAAHRLAGWGARPLRAFPPDKMKLILTDCISPVPLHKSLVLRDCIDELADPRFVAHERLALAKAAVATASNLRFGPEVGVSAVKKADADVLRAWAANVRAMSDDLRLLASGADTPAASLLGDARAADTLIEPGSLDAVFTSPPYPNEKDYSRTTRLEMVLLGFAEDRLELRGIKKGLLRSNTRGVYKEDADDAWADKFPAVQEAAAEIERRRIEMGKTSGFERLYARVTRLYFGGMARHLASLRPLLRPGASLGYVVGDQASYLRVMIRTGQILAEIGESLGYEKVGIDLFRTRLATATGEMMREEVVVLRWPG